MITPLSQLGLVAIASKLLNSNEFLEVYNKVFDEKNFNDESSQLRAIQDFWLGHAFFALAETFLSRELIYNAEASEMGLGGDYEDKEYREFLSTPPEEKCKKYRLVYPFLQDEDATWNHLTFFRPFVIRRVANSIKSRYQKEASHSFNVFHESFDLGLPISVRKPYLSRMSAVIRSLSSGSSRGSFHFPNQMIGNVDLDTQGGSGEGPELHADFEDLIKQSSRVNYNALLRLSRSIDTVASRQATAALSAVGGRGSHVDFSRFVHGLLYSAFLGGLGHNAHFVVVSVPVQSRTEKRDVSFAYMLSLLLERTLLVSEAFLSSASTNSVLRELYAAIRSDSGSIPIASVGGSQSSSAVGAFSRQVANIYLSGIRKTLSEALGSSSLPSLSLSTIPVSVPVSSLFHSGPVSIGGETIPVEAIRPVVIFVGVGGGSVSDEKASSLARALEASLSPQQLENLMLQEYKRGLSIK